MATKTDPFTPTMRLKGNSIKAKPECGHSPDYRWMALTGWTPDDSEYGGSYKGFLNTGYRDYDSYHETRSIRFDIDEWVQYLAEQFVNSNANTRQPSGMTRAINEVVKMATYNAEMLSGMAEFALRNPDVECVMDNNKGNRQGKAFFGNLPDEIGLIDGYTWGGTNYTHFRYWLSKVGHGSEQAGLAKVKSLPYLIHSAGDIFKAMVKGERTDCIVVRNILINRAIEHYASGSISPPEVSGLSFLDVCRDVWRRITQRGSWFAWDEIYLQDKPETFNPLNDVQQQVMRDAMQRRADYCLEMHNRWISAMA
jgi:hypothetical protein